MEAVRMNGNENRYLGSYGNAANTVVFPLTVIALAIAVMIGNGCCTFVSLSLGKKGDGPGKEERREFRGADDHLRIFADGAVSDF